MVSSVCVIPDASLSLSTNEEHVLFGVDEKWNEVKAFLASADKDGNGVLSREEFKGGIAALGVSDEDAAAVVQEVIYFIFRISTPINPA